MDLLSDTAASYETQDYLIYAQYMEKSGLSMVSAMNRHELNHDIFGAVGILIGITTLSLTVIFLLMYLI